MPNWIKIVPTKIHNFSAIKVKDASNNYSFLFHCPRRKDNF